MGTALLALSLAAFGGPVGWYVGYAFFVRSEHFER